jgi:hypothetical protein
MSAVKFHKQSTLVLVVGAGSTEGKALGSEEGK